MVSKFILPSPAKKSREEVKKQKEIDEGRKAGTIPAAVDEDGRSINPHIPQYIAQAPWYLNQEVPGLKHQRAKQNKPEVDLNQWYKRGQKEVCC